jgi:ferric-dicitrate binding protein FerR (iron transport regulator)
MAGRWRMPLPCRNFVSFRSNLSPGDTPMAPTFPSVDSATLKAFRKGDVSALERIHRATYAAIVADGSKQVGDAAAGPQVAETAMIQLWENRGNIETAEELDHAIHAAVRSAVTREQRRRAANKGAASPAAPGTVDSTWAHISAEASKGPGGFAGPKHATPRVKVAKPKNDGGGRGALIAVGVLLLIGAAYGAYYVVQTGTHDLAASSYSLPDAKTVSVTPGQRGNLPLGPGDTVAIGSDTKIVEGGDYGTKVRAVKVDGAANFHVASGVHFEVSAKNVSVSTTAGGTFGVRDYGDDPLVIVRVTDGEVKVDAGKESRTVATGKAIAVAKDGTMSEPTADAVGQAFSWTDGKLSFTNAPLKVVMNEMARWYNLPVTTTDTSLYARPVTMSVELTSSKDAIAALEQSANVKFTYDKDSKPVLEDAPAKPAAPAKKKK